MTSPRFPKLSALAIALLCPIRLSLFAPQSRAETPPQPTIATDSPAKPTHDDALAFLQADRIRDICQKPITFSITDATLEDVALRVEKLLSDADTTPKIRIEVRGPQPVNLSFAPKKSTIGDVLSSTADLAGAQLWVFSDHLLLAPEKALTPDEQSLLQKGMVTEAENRTDHNLSPYNIQRHLAFTTFISDEIKGLKALPTTQTTNAAPTLSIDQLDKFAKMSAHTLAANTTFEQLSANAQEMIKRLFAPKIESFTADQPASFLAMPQMPKLALAPNTPIVVLTGRDDQVELFLTGRDGMAIQMNWGINSAGGGWGVHFPVPKNFQTPQTSTPPAPPLPLDPSADKS